MHALVIRNGKLVDGSGAPARAADVAISGDRVVAVGDDVGPGLREIDAGGLLVIPGWVDVLDERMAQALLDCAALRARLGEPVPAEDLDEDLLGTLRALGYVR